MARWPKRNKCKVGDGQYVSIHDWLRKNYGSANKCENPDCLGMSTHFYWALKRGCEYLKIKENFIQLCASCHRHYDRITYSLEIKKEILDNVYQEVLNEDRY